MKSGVDIHLFVLDGLQAACDWVEGRVEACRQGAQNSGSAIETGMEVTFGVIFLHVDKLAFRVRQATAAHSALKSRIDGLTQTINAAEDAIFASFCRKIGVTNIREYEERQLKIAQEESQARLRFDTQIARLTHQ